MLLTVSQTSFTAYQHVFACCKCPANKAASPACMNMTHEGTGATEASIGCANAIQSCLWYLCRFLELHGQNKLYQASCLSPSHCLWPFPNTCVCHREVKKIRKEAAAKLLQAYWRAHAAKKAAKDAAMKQAAKDAVLKQAARDAALEQAARDASLQQAARDASLEQAAKHAALQQAAGEVQMQQQRSVTVMYIKAGTCLAVRLLVCCSIGCFARHWT